MKKITICFISLSLLFGCNLFESKGTLTINLTDAPLIIDQKIVTAINVTINEIKVSRGINYETIPEEENVEIIGDETDPLIDDTTVEWITISSTPQNFNLLELQNGITDIIGSAILETGRYNQLRLIVNRDNTITFEGDETLYDLKIPSDIQSGVKLTGGFIINKDTTTIITLDFDAQQSVHIASGEYILQPTIKIINVKKNI